MSKTYRRHESGISIHLMLMLISTGAQIMIHKPHFNTSHVNVNHVTVVVGAADEIDFNTSHVNVNHSKRRHCISNHIISIHLMLMLIAFSFLQSIEPSAFQYISC